MRFSGSPGLVLPGGGARAAYQVGVLKALAELTHATALPFRSVSGVSAGAINGMALAQGADNFGDAVLRLEQVWTGMTSSDVFTMELNLLQSFAGSNGKPSALLDNAPLSGLLERTVADAKPIADHVASGQLDGFAVTASSYSAGNATTFFQARPDLIAWHTRRRHSVATRIEVPHLLASSALPLLFPPQRVGDEYFVDGSLRMTQPLSPAIKMGADRILVIGVRNESMPTADFSLEPPSLGSIAGYTLDSLFSEQLNADIERMEEVNRLLKAVPFWRRSRLRRRPIRVMTIRPSMDLRTIAARFAVQLPRSIRLFLRTVGGWGKEWRMPSYLLFEADFARALIDLGYRDGLKQRPAVEAFFR